MSIVQSIALLIYLGILAWVLKHTDFSALLNDKGMQHRLFGASAILFLLWVLRVGIHDGLYVHFLWLSALTLCFGLRWAVLSGSLVLLGMTLSGAEHVEMFGVNALCGVLLPIAITYTVLSMSFHRLPQQLFVYIFVCAFFPGALTIVAKMLALGGYYLIDSQYTWDTVKDNYLMVIPLLAFPEALFNGMLMTVLVIYKPHWVYTFNDKFYIDGK